MTHDDGHRLQQYKWPGNIRALQNGIERAVLLSQVDRLRLALALADTPAVTAAVTVPTSRMSGDTPDAVGTDHDGVSAPISRTP